MRFAAHVFRKDDVCTYVIIRAVDGERGTGRPRARYSDNIREFGRNQNLLIYVDWHIVDKQGEPQLFTSIFSHQLMIMKIDCIDSITVRRLRLLHSKLNKIDHISSYHIIVEDDQIAS